MTTAHITPHLETDQLEQCYRKATAPAERSHYQIIWLLSQQRSVEEVSKITGYSERWIFEIVRRFNEDGPKGLGDRRHDYPGTMKPLLTPVQERDLRIALFDPPPEGGLWNGRKVADWIGNTIGRPVRRQRGWDYLKKLGYRLRKPRPQHIKGDQEQQRVFKKSC